MSPLPLPPEAGWELDSTVAEAVAGVHDNHPSFL